MPPHQNGSASFSLPPKIAPKEIVYCRLETKDGRNVFGKFVEVSPDAVFLLLDVRTVYANAITIRVDILEIHVSRLVSLNVPTDKYDRFQLRYEQIGISVADHEIRLTLVEVD